MTCNEMKLDHTHSCIRIVTFKGVKAKERVIILDMTFSITENEGANEKTFAVVTVRLCM